MSGSWDKEEWDKEELDETIWGEAVRSKRASGTSARKSSSRKRADSKKRADSQRSKKASRDKGFRPIFILFFIAAFMFCMLIGYLLSGVIMGDLYDTVGGAGVENGASVEDVRAHEIFANEENS